MTAKLEVQTDSTSVRRFFSDMTESSRRTADAMRSHFGKYVSFVESELKSLRQATAKSFAETDSDHRRFEESMANREKRRAEQKASEMGGYRDNAYREEEQAAERSERKITGVYKSEREKRLKLIKAEAEERKRVFAAVGEGTINAGVSLASQMHDRTQDARERRAIVQSTIADPLGQAGAKFEEIDAVTDRLRQFAIDQKIKVTDLATAMGNYQTTYSGLGSSTTSAADRGKNLDKFLNLAAYSRDVGLGVEEGTSLAGEMSRQGVTDEGLVKSVLNATSAIGQYGSVAAKDALKQGKGPMITRIKRAVAEAQMHGVQGEGLQTVVTDTVREVMAEYQMAAGSGEQIGTAGANMRNLQGSLNSFVRGGKMSNNIEQTKLLDKNQKKALLEALFQKDSKGKIIKDKLKEGLNDPAAFAEAWTGAVGTDPKLIGLLEGGGHGNAMSITAPQRKMLEYLVGSDLTGKTGAQFVRQIQGAQLSTGDVARQRDIAMRLDSNNMQAEKEQGDLNVRRGGDDSVLGSLSDKFVKLGRENPMAAAVLGVGASALAPALVKMGGSALGGALSSAAPRAGAGLLGNASRVLGPLGIAAGILLDPNQSIVSGEDEAKQLRVHQGWNKLDHNQQSSVVDFMAEQADSLGGGLGQSAAGMLRKQFEEDPNAFVARFALAISAALERAKLNVTIDPHAVEQSRSATAGQQARTPVQ